VTLSNQIQMPEVYDIWKNHLMASLQVKRRKELIAHLPELNSCPHENYLSLYDFLSRIPEQFFAPNIYKNYLAWIEDRHSAQEEDLKDCLEVQNVAFNQSFLFLSEINRYQWHDTFDNVDEYDIIRFIDQNVHPTYLRLIEAVFFPYVRLIAYFSRLDRGRQTEGLDIFNSIQELGFVGFAELSSVYKNTVRNGIAHGGITYLHQEIRYRDKRGNEEKLSDREAISLCDNLLDVCNALALSLAVFLLSHMKDGYTIPQQLLVQELRAEADAPWWHVEGCVESEISAQSQLIIFARPNTHDYRKVQYSAFLTGVLVEFFSPGYDRYFISLHSSKALPGWAAFDGQKLRKTRERGPKGIEDYKGVLENDLVFYVPRPKLPGAIAKLDTLIRSFQIQWQIVSEDFKKQLHLLQVIPRTATIHRNGWRAILNGSVVVHADQPLDQELIRKSRSRIVRTALSLALRDAGRKCMARYLPIGYARISVFSKNYRKRKLASFGLGSDLIGTIELRRIRRIKTPVIIGAEVELAGKYRIAWNSAWLKSVRDG